MAPGIPTGGAAPMRGLVSQPSISAQLMRAEIRAASSKIWMEDARKVWALVEVVSQDNTIVTIKHPDGQRDEIDLVSQLLPRASEERVVVDGVGFQASTYSSEVGLEVGGRKSTFTSELKPDQE